MDYRKEFLTATKVYFGILFATVLVEFFYNTNFGWDDVKEWTIINLLFNYPFYFANVFLTKSLDKIMPWNQGARKRALLGTLITILINIVVIYAVITLVSVFVYQGPANYTMTSNGKNMVLVTFVIVTIMTLIFYSIGFFKEMEKEKLLSANLKEEKVRAELSALKAQVDPHFLFNSFNVLSGLIDEDPRQAQKFLSGLSKIYRYILENRNEELVSLESELNFAKDYLKLQEIRFEDSVMVHFDVDDSNLSMQLPALSLQLVLENAIKHNGFDAKNPLDISIANSDNVVTVRNNKRKRTQLREGNGIGLANIRERYTLRQVTGFSIEDEKDFFAVHLPLITTN